MRIRTQNAVFRHVTARKGRGETAPQIAGYRVLGINWANVPGKVPAKLRGGLCQGPQTSAWGLASRKDTFCVRTLTERRTLEFKEKEAEKVSLAVDTQHSSQPETRVPCNEQGPAASPRDSAQASWRLNH